MAKITGEQHQVGSNEEKIWTTVYSDMVTNLMLFFLMLYGLSRMSDAMRREIMEGMEQKFRGKTEVEMRAEKVLKEVHEQDAANAVSYLMEQQGLKNQTSVEINEKRIKITLNIPVLFASGDATLNPKSKGALAGVAKVLAGVPNPVIIEGHTDNIAISGSKYPSNWELSVARSYNVIEYFVKEQGLDPARFIAAGYGEYRPIASNETTDGRMKNRRIEIVMIRKE